MPPTPAHGKVCYVEIPAADIDRSADFYAGVFGWRLRRRGDGRVAFDDATGGVSGTWVVGRRAGSEPGLLLYIMVDSVEETIEAILARGGELVQPVGRGRTRSDGEIPGPRWKRDRPLSRTQLTVPHGQVSWRAEATTGVELGRA